MPTFHPLYSIRSFYTPYSPIQSLHTPTRPDPCRPSLTFGALGSGPHVVTETAVSAEVEHAVAGAVGQTAPDPLVGLLTGGADPASQADAHALGTDAVAGAGGIGTVGCRSAETATRQRRCCLPSCGALATSVLTTMLGEAIGEPRHDAWL